MRFLYILIVLLYLLTTLNGQYIYFKTQSYDSLNQNNCLIIQKNLWSAEEITFLKYADCLSAITTDNLQKWLFVGERNSPVIVYSSQDTTNYFDLPDTINWVGRALYATDDERLFLFGTINENDFQQQLLVFNTETKSIINNLALPYSYSEYEEAFFSRDKSIIYFPVEDTMYLPLRPDKDKVYYFSTILNQIIKKIDLSQLGFPNSDGYILHKGSNGKSIIQSFFLNETRDSYFRIYNFDSDVGSTFIKHQGYTDPFFLKDGKYLILAETQDSADIEYYTGLISIYNVNSGALIKKMFLPPKGEYYIFDNYPTFLYYFLSYENRVLLFDIDTIVQKFNLNITQIGNGFVIKSPDQSEYDSSSVVKLKAFPSPGYKFQEWTGDVTGTVDSIMVILNSNKNITATFIQQTNSNELNVKLINSSGTKITSGNLQYYNGSWKDAINNNDGTFKVNFTGTPPKTISLRMNYEYASQTKSNVVVNSDTVVFQTVNAMVQLQNSQSALIDEGKVQYYSGAWREFGTTVNGIATKELLPNNYSFRMTYAFASKDKQQDINTSPTVVFQTVATNVELRNSVGNLINDQSTVQYYSGAWREFGTTVNGIATKELLPNNYSFRMTYAFASKDKQQDLNTNTTVVFQTVAANVELRNSGGNLITDPATVQYYSGSWREFGTTVNGVATKELLPNNYSFRMTYAFASKDKQQDLNTNTTVVFQTVAANVGLRNSGGNLITDPATVQYYSGSWREFGTTVNGVATKELLPNNYSFRMTYAFASKDKQQDLNTNTTVVFQTVATNVELRNSAGNLITDPATVQYYSGAWREFGTTVNGVANKELLPNNYSFRMSYAFASKDKQQDLNTNPIVVFQTVAANVELRNSGGNLITDPATVQYYSGAWREFGTTVNGIATKELLPNNYSFRMTYAFASKDKQQDLNTNPTVVFQTVATNVELRNSAGNLITDPATVQYYSGAWREFGTTVNGVATKELLPNNYSFRMIHEYISNDKAQDLAVNPTVNFQTVLCKIKVKDAQNQSIDNALASYYSGEWRQIGNTINGEITKELFPANLSFRIKHGSVQQDKSQNLLNNNIVEFILP